MMMNEKKMIEWGLCAPILHSFKAAVAELMPTCMSERSNANQPGKRKEVSYPWNTFGCSEITVIVFFYCELYL
jgi:hypothetical protein